MAISDEKMMIAEKVEKIIDRAGNRGVTAQDGAHRAGITVSQWYAAARILRGDDRPDGSTFVVQSSRNTKGEVVGSRYYHSRVATDVQMDRKATQLVRDARTRSSRARQFLSIEPVQKAARRLVLEELGQMELHEAVTQKQRAISKNDLETAQKWERRENRIAKQLIRAGVM